MSWRGSSSMWACHELNQPLSNHINCGNDRFNSTSKISEETVFLVSVETGLRRWHVSQSHHLRGLFGPGRGSGGGRFLHDGVEFQLHARAADSSFPRFSQLAD